MKQSSLSQELKEATRGRNPRSNLNSTTRPAERRSEKRSRTGGAILLWVILSAIAGLLFWAWKSELDSIVRGSGQVIPDSSKQVIQSLEGGIVSELLVSEGDVVAKGDVLLRLSDTQYASIHQSNETVRDTILARMARLEAEVDGLEAAIFPEELQSRRPKLIQSEQKLFLTRQEDQDSRTRFARLRLEKEQEKYEALKRSFEIGARPKVDRIDLETKIVDLQEHLETIRTGFRRESMERYDEERERLSTLLAEMGGDEDRVRRTTFRSPVDGIINKIHIETVGRVAAGGEPILEIVPENDTLLVEAKIRPADIAFLHKGQDVLVNFTAFDFSIYGGLKGQVETIGVDTIVEEQSEETYYPIKIRTYESDLGEDVNTGELLELVPGMVAEVNIITGKRTVLDYLLKPINRARYHALRER